MLVNRYWKHFFGRGIVDPEDDMSPTLQLILILIPRPSFVESDDLKLVRTICNSRTYQPVPFPTNTISMTGRITPCSIPVVFRRNSARWNQ